MSKASGNRWWGLMLGFVAVTLAAADWPQWRGPGRDGHAAPSEAVLDGLPADPAVLWRVKTGAGWASPVVAAGRVFYSDNQGGKETLHAVNAADGREVWRADVDAVMHDEQGPDGPRGTALVHGDHVFVQSCLGELQCRRVGDGGLVWRTNFRKDFGSPWLGEDSVIPGASEHGYTGSPVLVDGHLIAGVGSTNGAGFVSFAPETGAVQWRSQDDLAAYAAPFGSVLSGESQVIAFMVPGLVGLSPADGRVLWREPLTTSYGRNCLTPVVVGDRVITGSYRSGLMGVWISRKGPDWTASREWTNTAATMNFASPIAVKGFIYGAGPDRNLVCVAADSGRLAWSQVGIFTSAAGNSFASLIALGDRILVVTDGGEALLVAADPATYRELGRAQVCGRTWSHPAYADGRLYVCDGISGPGVLRCVDLLGRR